MDAKPFAAGLIGAGATEILLGAVIAAVSTDITWLVVGGVAGLALIAAGAAAHVDDTRI